MIANSPRSCWFFDWCPFVRSLWSETSMKTTLPIIYQLFLWTWNHMEPKARRVHHVLLRPLHFQIHTYTPLAHCTQSLLQVVLPLSYLQCRNPESQSLACKPISQALQATVLVSFTLGFVQTCWIDGSEEFPYHTNLDIGLVEWATMP